MSISLSICWSVFSVPLFWNLMILIISRSSNIVIVQYYNSSIAHRKSGRFLCSACFLFFRSGLGGANSLIVRVLYAIYRPTRRKVPIRNPSSGLLNLIRSRVPIRVASSSLMRLFVYFLNSTLTGSIEGKYRSMKLSKVWKLS